MGIREVVEVENWVSWVAMGRVELYTHPCTSTHVTTIV